MLFFIVRSPVHAIKACTIYFICGIVLYTFQYAFPGTPAVPSPISSILSASTTLLTDVQPANATLGFGAIYAVSGADADDRRYSLIQAANVTELEIRIPQLPRWTEDENAAFNEPIEPKLARGTTFAWMSHEFVLRQYVATNGCVEWHANVTPQVYRRR